MKLVALYSPVPQSGKSTVARYLISKGWKCISFSTPLKRMLEPVLRSLGYVDTEIFEMLYGADKEKLISVLGNKTTRQLMQTLGTDWGRNLVYQDLWILCWKGEVQQAMKNGHNVVTDDLRFLNEMEAVRSLQGKCWWIDRPVGANTYGHASEGALNDYYDQFDAVIHNNHDIEVLNAKLDLHLDDPNLRQVTMNIDGIARATFEIPKDAEAT